MDTNLICQKLDEAKTFVTRGQVIQASQWIVEVYWLLRTEELDQIRERQEAKWSSESAKGAGWLVMCCFAGILVWIAVILAIIQFKP